MPRRRTESRSFLLTALVAWVLLVAGSSLLPAADASADPLEGVTGPVNEVTAPVREAVEQVVPPVTAPAPAPAPEPPAAQLPEVKAPTVPTKPPAQKPAPEAAVKIPTPPPVETATKTVEAATKTVTDSAEAVTATGAGTAERTQSAVREVTEATEKTVGSATASAETVLSAPTASAGTKAPPSASGGSIARHSAAASDPPAGSAGATAVPPDVPTMVFPGLPARILRPFIHVWPAVALMTEGPLGSFIGHWSRAVQELLEESRTGATSSLPGEASPLADPAPAAPSTQQPPFDWFTSPTLTPFNLVDDESALVVLALFLVAGASTLVMLALGKRELGLPLLRRRNRFPWKH